MTELVNPFDRWMLKQSLEYAKTEGVETVAKRLDAQGYHNVADALRKKGKTQ